MGGAGVAGVAGQGGLKREQLDPQGLRRSAVAHVVAGEGNGKPAVLQMRGGRQMHCIERADFDGKGFQRSRNDYAVKTNQLDPNDQHSACGQNRSRSGARENGS